MGDAFVKYPIDVLECKEIGAAARIIYGEILNYQNMNFKNPVSKSYRWFMDRLGLSEREVRTGLKELEENRLITKKSGRPNSYSIWSYSQISRTNSQINLVTASDNLVTASDTYTLYKKNIKRNSKRILKEGGEPRDEAERKFMKLACNPPTYQHDKNVVDYLEDADRRFKDPEWWSR